MHHPDLDRDHADRVPVGPCAGDGGVTDNAVSTSAVHDVDRLSQIALQQSTEHASHRVGAAACTPRNDQGDGASRIGGLRRQRRQQAEHGQHPCGATQERLHSVSSSQFRDRTAPDAESERRC